MCLRLSHPSADPASWTEAIGLPADVCERLGEPRIRGRNGKAYGTAKVSFWTHPFPPPCESLAFEDHLEAIVGMLRDRGDFLSKLVEDGGDAELFIGYFLERGNTGFALPARLQRDLAALNLDLVFDIYDWTKDDATVAVLEAVHTP
ncbi:MAG: DUF4279 domain-containing protein [Arenimonas sp.]